MDTGGELGNVKLAIVIFVQDPKPFFTSRVRRAQCLNVFVPSYESVYPLFQLRKHGPVDNPSGLRSQHRSAGNANTECNVQHPRDFIP